MPRKLVVALLIVFVALVLVAYAALRENPARPTAGEREIAASGTAEIHYFKSGAGRGVPVLLVASFGRSASDFNELVAALHEAGHPTLAVQLRGVDGSTLPSLSPTLHTYAADLEAVLDDAIVDERVALVGHAYGNRVVRTFAADFPERVAGVVLLAAGGDLPPSPEMEAALQRALLQIWPEATRTAAIRSAFFAPGNPVPADWLRGWYPLAGIAQARATANTPFAEWGAGGTARTLVIEPEEDALAGGAAARLEARFPGRFEFESIPGAGHALLPEQPDAVARSVLRFIASLPRGPAGPH